MLACFKYMIALGVADAPAARLVIEHKPLRRRVPVKYTTTLVACQYTRSPLTLPLVLVTWPLVTLS